MNPNVSCCRIGKIASVAGLLFTGMLIGAVWQSVPTSELLAQVSPSEFPPVEPASPVAEPGSAQGGSDSAGGPLVGNVGLIQARQGRDVAGSGNLIGFSHVDDSGTQVITLVETQKMWMAVYHVGSAGEIRLVSSRAIDADFTLQLNATEPLPEQIRRMRGADASR